MKIPKIKNKAFIIDTEIYPLKIFVVLGDIKQLKDLLFSYKKPPTQEQFEEIRTTLTKDLDCYNGFSYQIKFSSNFIIWVAKDCNPYDIVPHEVLHTVSDYFNSISMQPMCKENEEAFCYLNGYINKKIFEQL